MHSANFGSPNCSSSAMTLYEELCAGRWEVPMHTLKGLYNWKIMWIWIHLACWKRTAIVIYHLRHIRFHKKKNHKRRSDRWSLNFLPFDDRVVTAIPVKVTLTYYFVWYVSFWSQLKHEPRQDWSHFYSSKHPRSFSMVVPPGLFSSSVSCLLPVSLCRNTNVCILTATNLWFSCLFYPKISWWTLHATVIDLPDADSIPALLALGTTFV